VAPIVEHGSTRPGAAGRSGDHGWLRFAERGSAADRITTSSSATMPRARRRTHDRSPPRT
jgi:hypothetical protein